MARTDTNSLARSLHDIGLAAWFGGSLMGAVGLNGASNEVSDYRERTRVANAGWGRWTPVNAAAIAVHMFGATKLTTGNKGRIAAQKGVGSMAAMKGALTFAAGGATAYARILGQKVMDAEAEAYQRDSAEQQGLAVEGATTPAPSTREDVAQAQRRLALLQWAVPALTGALLVLNARMGEQQRPTEVVRGIAGRAKRS
jgi:hypothetical protein